MDVALVSRYNLSDRGALRENGHWQGIGAHNDYDHEYGSVTHGLRVADTTPEDSSPACALLYPPNNSVMKLQNDASLGSAGPEYA